MEGKPGTSIRRLIGEESMRVLSYVVVIALLSACGTGAPGTAQSITDATTGLTLQAGYHAEIVARGLNAPTHAAVGPEGALYLTQLNGGENDGTGQVVRIKAAGATPEIMLDGLFKPTGLTFAGGALYVVAGNNVLVSRARGAQFEPPTPLFKDLPYNGRSNGQIALGPDGLLYFQSTGDDLAASTSGLIYTAKPDGTEQKTLARGLKNAYAFAWNPHTGQMYATEIGDDSSVEVPEELNAIRRGGDYGWPPCYGKQQENGARGGNRNICADTDVPLATFPPHSTPTGLAFFDGRLIVALWGGQPPRLLSVDPRSGQVEEFAGGFKRPIALLAAPDGGLLVVDMDGGTLFRLSKRAS